MATGIWSLDLRAFAQGDSDVAARTAEEDQVAGLRLRRDVWGAPHNHRPCYSHSMVPGGLEVMS